MKREPLSLRTAFLLALAGWSAAVWLATGFGLGSRLPAGGADADPAAALPVLPAFAPERMASADSYSAIAARPLFAEDRRPRPYLLGGSEPSASAALRLTGVLLTDDFGLATFSTEQNRSLRLRLNGDAVDGWQLVALQPRQATVIGPGGSQVLELAVFNGQGGEPPTVLRGSAGAPAPGVPVPPPVVPLPAQAAPAQAATAPQRAADATPAPASAAAPPPPANSNGPSEAQMQAIRERIQARRRQLQQQQQQQQQSPPPSGNGANR